MTNTAPSSIERIGQHCVRVGRTLYCEVADHFIPHERNQYRPHVLSHRVLVGYSVLLILIKVLVIAAPIALPSSSLYSSAITAGNIIDLTNQTRANLNLSKLISNGKLASAALAKANDMVTQQYFSHESPDGRGLADWLANAGYGYLASGENLAVHYMEAEDVEEGWLASPSHRANIVNPRYTEIGIGVSQGTFENVPATFVVQMFGEPAPATSPVFERRVTAASKERLSAVRITPERDGYKIRVATEDATSVVARFAAITTPLEKKEGDVWEGSIAHDQRTANATGESLTVTAAHATGTAIDHPVALIAGAVTTQKLYTFNEGNDRYAKFFGGLLTIHNLEDSTRRFYLFFAIFLVAALVVNIMIKVRIQHPSIINHTMLVIALTLLLTIV